MIRTSCLLVTLVAISGGFAGCCALPQSATGVNLVVEDFVTGNAVPGVTILEGGVDLMAHSDSQDCFDFGARSLDMGAPDIYCGPEWYLDLGEGEHTLQVVANGYEPAQVVLTVTSEDSNNPFCTGKILVAPPTMTVELHRM